MKNQNIKRNQFTFYASYYEAVESLPKSRKYEALSAIIRYGLYGEEPVGLGSASSSVFRAVRPHLENGRKKAAACMKRNMGEAAEPAAAADCQ